MTDWVPILTHYPGKILEFDGNKQTAKVQVMREQFRNTLYTLYEEYEFPILQDVVVNFPQGGDYVMTFPVNKGDNCILSFCDKGISHWVYDGAEKIGQFSSTLPKADYFRSYNLNDAVAHVGYNPIPQAIANFNTSGTELRNKARTQRVTLLPTGVMEVVTPTTLHITAPNSTMDGNMTINGALHVTGKITCDDTVTSSVDVFAQTVSLHNHITTGVTAGNGLSNVPKV